MDRKLCYEERSGMYRREVRSTQRYRNSKCTKEEEGMVRMKIVLTKKQFKQLMAVIGGANAHYPSSSSVSSSSSSSPMLEQLLGLMQKKQGRRGGYGSWSPVLQSIPEEI